MLKLSFALAQKRAAEALLETSGHTKQANPFAEVLQGGFRMPWRGAAAGAGAGILSRGGQMMHGGVFDPTKWDEIAAAAKALPAEGRTLAQESVARNAGTIERLRAAGLGQQGGMFTDKPWEWTKAMAPDIAKSMASWAGTGALGDLAVQGFKNYKRQQMLNPMLTYGLPAAAGLGAYGLASS